MINELLSAILQILVFALIPFLVYLIKTRSVKGFLDYIGLKPSNSRANMLALLVMLVIVVPLLTLIFLSKDFKAIMINPESVTGKIRQMGLGVEAIVTIMIAAILKTSLSEEIFFRGFVAKRLIAVTNFRTGNLIQALIFGIMHTLLFMLITNNVLFLTVIFIFPTAGAYLSVYLNEKMANGSIIPGWIAHASANLVSYFVVAFII